MLITVENPLFSMQFPHMVRTFGWESSTIADATEADLATPQCKDFQKGFFESTFHIPREYAFCSELRLRRYLCTSFKSLQESKACPNQP